jgi:hypothetical protein
MRTSSRCQPRSVCGVTTSPRPRRHGSSRASAQPRRAAGRPPLRRFSVLFFIELGSRRVHLAGCTTNPSGAWVAQQAGNLSFAGLSDRMRFLTRDRDNKFSAAIDEVFRSERIR